MRLLNIGNIEIEEPLSCVNTLRNSIPSINHQPNSYSEPNSRNTSPTSKINGNITHNKKKLKKKKSNSKSIKMLNQNTKG